MLKPPPHRCLDRLKRRDLEFIAAVLKPDTPREREALFRLLTDAESLREILDQDVVHRAVIEQAMPLTISPELYFYVLVRRALRQAGIEDVRIAEYVSATLAQHAYGEPGGSSAMPTESGIDYHIDILQALERATHYERFFLQVCCGNRFMFLTGLFPRFIRNRRDRRGAPGLRYYEEVARRAYQEAGNHPLADEFALAGVYHGLAETLHDTRQALNHLAEHHLFLD